MLSHHFPNSIAYLSDEQMFAIPPVNATSVAINRNQIYETLEEIEAMHALKGALDPDRILNPHVLFT